LEPRCLVKLQDQEPQKAKKAQALELAVMVARDLKVRGQLLKPKIAKATKHSVPKSLPTRKKLPE
jgi:hypothetical protein